MGWIIYGAIAVLMIYLMFKGGCCGGHAGHGGHNGSHGGHQGGGCCGGSLDYRNNSKHEGHIEDNAENTMDRNAGMIQDPVCGMYLSKQEAISRVINGRTYYFCSSNCADEFERKQGV